MAAIWLAAGCGRIAFDQRGDGTQDGARGDTASDGLADGSRAPITLVQQATNEADAVAAMTVTLGSAVGSGDVLVMTASTDTMITGIQSVAGGGAAWMQVSEVAGSGGSCTGCIRGAMWSGQSAAGGSTSITVTFAEVAPDDVAVSVSEWSGLGPTLGGVVTAGPLPTTTVQTGALTTTQADQLVLAMGAWDRADISAGPTNGFASLDPAVVPSNSYLASAWLIAPSPASVSTGWDLTASPQAWIGIIAAFSRD